LEVRFAPVLKIEETVENPNCTVNPKPCTMISIALHEVVNYITTTAIAHWCFKYSTKYEIEQINKYK
jgi:hypothetical protein